MTPRRKTVKRISLSAAVLALAVSGLFSFTATPAFAEAPPAGWNLFGQYPTESACEAAGNADWGKYGWADWGCYQWPPGRAPWDLYYVS
jgi:hypothetical protein